MNVSLRGLLAQELADRAAASADSDKVIEEFIDGLMESDDPDLVKRFNGGILIIGRLSERGKFLPDW